MEWRIQDTNPIYMQLAEAIKRRIVCGEYQPGGRIPSVRDLATEAEVNPNTMQRAFVELEDTGLIITFRTSGKLITSDTELIEKTKVEMAQSLKKEMIEKFAEIGMTTDDIIRLLKK